jgi:hypothetical protein
MVVTDKPEDGGAVFYMEDDTMEQRLRAFVGGLKRRTQT